MTKIYKCWNSYKSNSHILEYKWRERKTDSYIFMQGKNLPFDCGYVERLNTLQDPKDYDLIYHAEISEEKLKGYACMPNNSQAPLVNQKVLDMLLELCPDEFQYFPVTIVGENPKYPFFENHDYCLINICKTVDIVDQSQSKIKYFESGNFDSIEKLFIKNSIQKFNISRIKYSTIEIIAAEPLVKAFKKAKINGVKFELLGETTFVE